MQKHTHKAKQPASGLWQHPWGWREAAVVQISVLVLALVAQMVVHALNARPTLPVPWNWAFPIAFIGVAGLLGASLRTRPLMRWLSGVPFAVTAIVIYALLGLVGTLVPQEADVHDWLARWGMRALFTSLPFFFASLVIMLNLAAAVGRRSLSGKPGYLAFMLNHVGLLLVMVGMVAGQAQLIKATVVVPKGGEKVSVGTDDVKSYHLGGDIALQNFTVDYYPTKSYLVGLDMQAMMHQQPNFQTADTAPATKGHVFEVYGMSVRVLDYLPSAMQGADGSWSACDHCGSPALKVEITVPSEKITTTGWLAEGIGNAMLAGSNHALMLTTNQIPKTYRSYVTITEKGKKPVSSIIEVNKPGRLGPWRLYQMDYDHEGLNYSVLEAVKDPALPVVYTGLVCMLLGAFLAFWLPKGKNVPETEVAE